MDPAVVLGVAALLVSILAVFASTALSTWQVRLLRNANQIPAIVELLSEFRKVQLHDDYDYVINSLQLEHDSALGISALPESARRAALNIAYYFNQFAFLVGFGVLDDQRLFMTGIRHRIIAVWSAIEPFVQAERRQQGLPALVMLESLSLLADAPAQTRGARFFREHILLRRIHRTL